MSQDLLPGVTLLEGVTGVLALADGTILQGVGCGAIGDAVGEVCFNTAMTGYQEILTDPSYMAQIVAFTFPHVGNVGTNSQDVEQITGVAETAARGALFRDTPTQQANWRAGGDFDAWMKARGVIGLAGIDTRALTRKIRETGMPHGVIAHSPDGKFDLPALVAKAKAWKGLVGLDLAKDASTTQTFTWDEGLWSWPEGYAKLEAPKYEVVVVDYGVKRNILRALAHVGARATVVPADTKAEDILARNPDGVLLSNGPGDPAATGQYAVPEIQKLVDSGKPVFGICLGHQMLALALGAKTVKMEQGHHGANHPVKDLTTGKVEIVSMNHGFTVDSASLPAPVQETHVSLFDGTNAGIALSDKPVFSVQHHPEASPGPTDSLYLFERFAGLMDQAK
ncbi:glutamine-hydrolyzing carbamoyl-phosphate synthase small subunit [uncultured Caulobacter sp.]|uniref:glutamine-hydrolyzing carbamoyl-phosphate synthase small subunit n=1 Tax=uncultured Caulobacter sp. TaxID=158749 RepID=UPI00260EAF4D|nr:glutamine-hydrolyzing carbamoyl-phosphate synthase small subunit [uncultured Caulobacter sp.]